ncbi:UV DNA damage repair endonuclease UvsE [Rossellomorea vietnamensis]|uniref:UV DNA damage repair endonuclease UvsE n=1 Tax=Rossellomorea vietnamensis TaxID=218284 RepID=UPI001E57D8A0|nr:UV DNA damage repair endonuclease UvsE [Rossellomorea vietnamensis]MCC5803994.1 UV DNA damage repair endonuclease UvsE [Rossellomorea vietnamensis]
MTLVKLGYVAMSMNLQNASPSQTMTYKQFAGIKDREAAIHKLERIAKSNLQNCLRLLKHNVLNEIHFFRFSSKLIPLANHPELKGWDFISPLQEELREIEEYLKLHPMRVGFHPDHFVLLNSSDVDVLKNTLKTLKMHEALLKGMGIDPTHRCVLHVGGAYEDKEKALEQFIHNWGLTPVSLQRMIILENDDTVFSAADALYLCEKLGIPLVFDYHHHLACNERDWLLDWDRVVGTWSQSPLPVKMHISSPRSREEYKAHADFIEPGMFLDFLHGMKGSVDEIDCMIEAKKKDDALFRLVEDLQGKEGIEWVDKSSFIVK